MFFSIKSLIVTCIKKNEFYKKIELRCKKNFSTISESQFLKKV